MTIRNVHGQMDRYDYVVESEDHGYSTITDASIVSRPFIHLRRAPG